MMKNLRILSKKDIEIEKEFNRLKIITNQLLLKKSKSS